MIERRIRGRVVNYEDTRDDFFFTLSLEGDFKGRYVFANVPCAWRGACALLSLALIEDHVVSMRALYEERSGVMLVHKVKDFKVEDDVLDEGGR